MSEEVLIEEQEENETSEDVSQIRTHRFTN